MGAPVEPLSASLAWGGQTAFSVSDGSGLPHLEEPEMSGGHDCACQRPSASSSTVGRAGLVKGD